MEGVPRTPTYTDRFEEVRALNLEIARLKAVRENAERETALAVASADALEERRRALEEAISRLEETVRSASHAAHEHIEHCRSHLQEATAFMEEGAKGARRLAGRVDALVREIGDLELKKDAVIASIAREQELMSVQRRDLGIYRRRIEAAAAEHLPGQKVEIAEEGTA